jgi:hypothetical protein
MWLPEEGRLQADRLIDSWWHGQREWRSMQWT